MLQQIVENQNVILSTVKEVQMAGPSDSIRILGFKNSHFLYNQVKYLP